VHPEVPPPGHRTERTTERVGDDANLPQGRRGTEVEQARIEVELLEDMLQATKDRLTQAKSRLAWIPTAPRRPNKRA
jgi:hypothetical protein